MTLDRSLPVSRPEPSEGDTPGPRAGRDDGCPIDRVLSVVQSVWSIKILWWLNQGPKRFGELRRALGGISAKVLTGRLRRLETEGLLSRETIDTLPPQVEYALTDRGRAFAPVLAAMSQLAERLSGTTCPGPTSPPAARRSGVRARSPRRSS